jgi:hypothetical protein
MEGPTEGSPDFKEIGDTVGCLAGGLPGCITPTVIGRVASAGDPVTP